MRYLQSLLLPLVGLVAANAVRAEPAIQELPPVTVTATAETLPVSANEQDAGTRTELGPAAIRLFGGPGQTNPQQALQYLPSVNFQSADPYGLSSNQPPGNPSMRIRGRPTSSPGSPHSLRTVEDLPLTGAPGGGAAIYDLENIQALTVYKGAMLPDKGLGFGNIAGNINLRMRRPDEEPGVFLKQDFGSFDFFRTFLRGDSGRLPSDTRLFGSYSYTTADKWRGSGGSPDYRHNGGFGLTQDFGESVKLELFGVVNDQKHHDFRPLTEIQARQLGRFNDFDFNSRLSGNPARDISYYDFNRQAFTDASVFANLEIKTSETSRLSLKPYYWHDEGFYLLGMPMLQGAPGVRRWDINHDLWGLLGKFDFKGWDTDFTLGYWYHEQEPPGPPTSWKAYRIAGDDLRFAGWALLNKQSHHIFHSPFVAVHRQFGSADLSAGLRYVVQQTASITSYRTANLPDVSYSEVFDYRPAVDPSASVGSRRFSDWLPYFGATYALSENHSLRFSYGRNFNAMPLHQYPTYIMSRRAFEAAGVTLQQLWNQQKPGQSDNFDLGARFSGDNWFVAPTLYYSTERGKAVTAFDPELGVSYYQTARARAYGAEIDAGLDLLDGLSLYGAFSYNRYELSDDIRTAGNALLRVAGHQVPDSPEVEGKLFLTYRLGNFSISPGMRYIGERYGDVENRMRLPSYAIADLHLNYEHKKFAEMGDLNLGLSFLNVFDKQYIAVVNARDDQRPGTTTYYPGAPLTVVGTVSLRF
ncbi:ligand-gated TonB-dependent outer membrane channel [Methylocaldum marinum]|uniref:Ligand-gated TonB-dependent outer membrane channel n=1 Tax=Methylocaldum marinum TaxID=1432792 RepID=A0A250KU03_9GAMM|nr:TonB-dependent receptor [Methylocaldum marinum]BBA35052.1 ligand-gated TonB-dependent outer membrane channel [Methylocaldum marinum]